jgi:hypothetical protein
LILASAKLMDENWRVDAAERWLCGLKSQAPDELDLITRSRCADAVYGQAAVTREEDRDEGLRNEWSRDRIDSGDRRPDNW